MAYEFPDNRYNDVRSVIGLDITSAILPDDVLALPTFEGEAERFIEKYLTSDQYENPDYTSQVDTAAVYYLASLAAPTIPEVSSERIAGGSITYKNVDRMKQAEILKSRAVDILGEIDVATGESAAATNPNIFTVAPRRYW